jgi:hypothetical protein
MDGKVFIMGNSTAKLDPQTVLVMLRPPGLACENAICYRRLVA